MKKKLLIAAVSVFGILAACYLFEKSKSSCNYLLNQNVEAIASGDWYTVLPCVYPRESGVDWNYNWK